MKCRVAMSMFKSTEQEGRLEEALNSDLFTAATVHNCILEEQLSWPSSSASSTSSLAIEEP